MKYTMKNACFTDIWFNNPEEELRSAAMWTDCEVSNVRVYGLIFKNLYFDVTGTKENINLFKIRLMR